MRNRPDKPLAIRNGLKVYTKLKAKKAMRIISPKQKKINKTWRETTDERIAETGGVCLWCELPGSRTGWNFLTGHHIIPRRYNVHTKENCYPCHFQCHDFIETHSINIKLFPNKRAWEAEVGH